MSCSGQEAVIALPASAPFFIPTVERLKAQKVKKCAGVAAEPGRHRAPEQRVPRAAPGHPDWLPHPPEAHPQRPPGALQGHLARFRLIDVSVYLSKYFYLDTYLYLLTCIYLFISSSMLYSDLWPLGPCLMHACGKVSLFVHGGTNRLRFAGRMCWML